MKDLISTVHSTLQSKEPLHTVDVESIVQKMGWLRASNKLALEMKYKVIDLDKNTVLIQCVESSGRVRLQATIVLFGVHASEVHFFIKPTANDIVPIYRQTFTQSWSEGFSVKTGSTSTFDYHNHTAYSLGGDLSPSELVRDKTKNNLELIAITDYYSDKGVDEAQRWSRRMRGPVVVRGAEVSYTYNDMRVDFLVYPHDKTCLEYRSLLVNRNNMPCFKQEFKHIEGCYFVLAHPQLTFGTLTQIEEFISFHKDSFQGLEVYHPTTRDFYELKMLAYKHGLEITGGSDYRNCGREDFLLEYFQRPPLVSDLFRRFHEGYEISMRDLYKSLRGE
jgi:histidinol phosphatase-like PHP family hydrolase